MNLRKLTSLLLLLPLLLAGLCRADDDGPLSTLTFAQFKKAVAKVQLPGYQRMPELSADGEHGLMLVGADESGFSIMAHGAGVGADFEKLGEGRLSRFKHKGRDAFYAKMTDDEGKEMACIIVKCPEHRMSLLVAGKPVKPRAELMKLLEQIEL